MLFNVLLVFPFSFTLSLLIHNSFSFTTMATPLLPPPQLPPTPVSSSTVVFFCPFFPGPFDLILRPMTLPFFLFRPFVPLPVSVITSIPVPRQTSKHIQTQVDKEINKIGCIKGRLGGEAVIVP